MGNAAFKTSIKVYLEDEPTHTTLVLPPKSGSLRVLDLKAMIITNRKLGILPENTSLQVLRDGTLHTTQSGMTLSDFIIRNGSKVVLRMHPSPPLTPSSHCKIVADI
jgi:hypothetical protein